MHTFILLAATLLAGYFLGTQTSDNPVQTRLGRESPFGDRFTALGCVGMLAVFLYAFVFTRWYAALGFPFLAFLLGALVFGPLGGPLYRLHAKTLLRWRRARQHAAGDEDGARTTDDLLRRLDEPAAPPPPAAATVRPAQAAAAASSAPPGPPKIYLHPEAEAVLAPLLALKKPAFDAFDLFADAETRGQLKWRFEFACESLGHAYRDLKWLDSPDAEQRAGASLLTATTEMQKCWNALLWDRTRWESLSEKLKLEFERFVEPMWARLDLRAAAVEVQGPPNRVLRVSEEEYVFLCALCGGSAERFRIVGENVAFSRSPGALVPQYFPRDQAPALFQILVEEGVKALHEHLVTQFPPRQLRGVHGYCPECERMYCMQHYTVEEEWDESWFHGARGACPRSHWRELA